MDLNNKRKKYVKIDTWIWIKHLKWNFFSIARWSRKWLWWIDEQLRHRVQTQPANNVPRTSLYVPVLFETHRNKTFKVFNLFWLCNVWYEPGIRKYTKIYLKNLLYGKCLNWRPEDVPRTSSCSCCFGTFLGRS